MSSDAESSSFLRIAMCQFPVSPDKSSNHETASAYIKEAASKGAQMVVLPEVWNSPYATAAFPEYAEDLTDSPSTKVLESLSKDLDIWIIGGSIPESHAGKIFNTCQVFSPDGQVVARHRKAHLFDVDVPGGVTFFESETLSAGNSPTQFSTPWGSIGVGICYDIRFAEYAMLLRDCKVLIYPGAFNMTTGPAHWELLQRARALDNQCFVVTASPARSEEVEGSKYPHYAAWGHSTAVSPWGDVIATTDEKEGVVVVDLDMKRVDEVRAAIPIRKQRRTDMYELKEIESK